MSPSRLVLLTLAALVAGCGSETPSRAASPQLSATRSTTFGDAEGEGALTNVWGFAVSDDGHVFLSEPPLARVVAFNPDGSFDRVVGGRGQGPGEFTVPGALWWRGDSLAVVDFQRGISLFGPDGAFATLIAFHVSDGSPFGVRPLLVLADGAVAAMAPTPAGDAAPGAVETWLKTSRDGEILDTLATVALAGRQFSVPLGQRSRGGLHPVGWDPVLAPSPLGSSLLLVDRTPATSGDPTTYRLTRLGVGGDTLESVALSYDPVPLLGGQVDSIAAAIAGRWASGMDATEAALARDIRDQIEWPAFQPPVTRALVGRDGSVWLRREMVGAAVARWDVLDESLSPAGWVELPVGLDVKAVSLEGVYGVELDDFDVPTVVKYEIGGR